MRSDDHFGEGDVELLRAGDLGALERCYRAFGERVRRTCRGLLGRERGDDAAQDVFVKVLERARQFGGEARFSTWLYRVAVNHCLHVRERELRRAVEPLPEALADGRTEPELDARDGVERMLAGLPEDQRAALVLRELEGLEYREIADVLGVPEGTVMSRLHRARRRLIDDAAARATAGRIRGS